MWNNRGKSTQKGTEELDKCSQKPTERKFEHLNTGTTPKPLTLGSDKALLTAMLLSVLPSTLALAEAFACVEISPSIRASKITLYMGTSIHQRTKSESWEITTQSIQIGPSHAWAQRFLTKNSFSANGWDYNFCQNKAFPKRRTVTLTPFWCLLFNLPEKILSTVTTSEGVRQFWEITLLYLPYTVLSYFHRCVPFCLVVQEWLHMAIIPILGSKYKESILHLCSLQMSAFSCCTISLPLIMFFLLSDLCFISW